MVQLRQQLAIELMREADVATVQEIEREIFATPWPRNAYYRELASRASAHYIVLRRDGLFEAPPGVKTPDFDPTIVGYGGMWRMYDEAHGTTIGVRHDLQHQGLGRIGFAGPIPAPHDQGRRGSGRGWLKEAMALTLGIETSCDETSVAVVEDGRRILSNVIHSQVDLHREFGGVVPELAARDHLERLPHLLDLALERAGARPQDIDLIAATLGPGLAGCLLVGVGVGEGLSPPWPKPPPAA